MHCWIFSSTPVLYSVGARSTPQCDNQKCLRHCQASPSEHSFPSVGDCLSQRRNTACTAREDRVPVLAPCTGALPPWASHFTCLCIYKTGMENTEPTTRSG